MSTLDNPKFYDWCLNNSQYGRYLLDECIDKSIYEKEFNSTEVTEWKCFSCSNTWTTSLESRTRLENSAKCPNCNNGFHYKMIPAARAKKGSISLLDYCRSEGEYGLKLYKEYLGIDEQGSYYAINEISYGRSKKLEWQCIDCGHKWPAKVSHRTTNKRGCPACAGQVVTDKNSLESWCKSNGSWGQLLLEEWVGLDEDGNSIDINEISHGSHKKVKWQCIDCGHKWPATASHRTICKSGCPECSTKGTSYSEKLIYYSIKQVLPETQSRYQAFKEEYPRGIEFDIAIPTADSFIFIEYSPTYWHDSREERDRLKRKICQSKGIRLIEIIDDSYGELEETWESNLIVTNVEKWSKREDILFKIIDFILKSLGHSIDEIDVEKAKSDAWNSSKGKIEYEKSLEYVYPELAKEWHPTLNGDLKPSEILPGSSYKKYFQCINCGHGKNGEWKRVIYNRKCNKNGCPKCGYSWYKATQGLPQKLKKTLYLSDEYPELAKEWHPYLNGDLKPSDITSGSGKEPYWQCPNCNHGKNGEWQSIIYNRTHYRNGCPKCGYNWYKTTKGLPQKLRKMLKKSTVIDNISLF